MAENEARSSHDRQDSISVDTARQMEVTEVKSNAILSDQVTINQNLSKCPEERSGKTSPLMKNDSGCHTSIPTELNTHEALRSPWNARESHKNDNLFYHWNCNAKVELVRANDTCMRPHEIDLARKTSRTRELSHRNESILRNELLWKCEDVSKVITKENLDETGTSVTRTRGKMHSSHHFVGNRLGWFFGL